MTEKRTWVGPSAPERLNILRNTRTIAIVGMSDKISRASYFVATYLQSASPYKLYFVNPILAAKGKLVLGQPVYPSLQDLPEVPDLVEIFRRNEDLPGVVQEAVDLGAKTVWMIGFQIVGGFFSSFFMIAATSIVPVISRTEADRTLLSQRKAQGNMLVKVLFAAVSLPAILAINGLVYSVPAGENEQNAGPAGFTVLAIIFGVFMIAMFIVMYKRIDGMDPTQKICEERAAAKKRGEKVPPIDAGEKVNIGEMIKYWITNLPAVIGLFSEIIRFIAQMTIMSMAMYVFTYAFGDVKMTAVMLTACNITGLVATFVSEPIARKLGIRITYLAGIGISFVFALACLLIGASGMMTFIVCICGIFFGMNFMNGTMMGMQSNAIAYGEWRDGKTAKAFIMSTFQWCPKIANAVAGVLTGFGLASIGFVSGMEATPELAQGMITIICLIPAVCFGIAFVAFFFGYRLTPKKMEQISADLAEREAEKKLKEAEAQA